MPAHRIAVGILAVCGLWQSRLCVGRSHARAGDKGLPTSYGGGRAIQEFTLPGDAVRAAVGEAMADLKMTSIQPRRNGAVYKIQAKTEDNRSVLVTLRPHQGQTRVSCRIGWFGDEPLSKALLERTGVRLGTLPPAAIPDNPPSSPGATHLLARRPCPTRRCSRTSRKHPIAIASCPDLSSASFSLANRGPR